MQSEEDIGSGSGSGTGSGSGSRPLIFPEKIIEEGGLEIITVNLYRLNESELEESNGIVDTLTLIESFLDIDASIPAFGSGGADKQSGK